MLFWNKLLRLFKTVIKPSSDTSELKCFMELEMKKVSNQEEKKYNERLFRAN